MVEISTPWGKIAFCERANGYFRLKMEIQPKFYALRARYGRRVVVSSRNHVARVLLDRSLLRVRSGRRSSRLDGLLIFRPEYHWLDCLTSSPHIRSIDETSRPIEQTKQDFITMNTICQYFFAKKIKNRFTLRGDWEAGRYFLRHRTRKGIASGLPQHCGCLPPATRP